MINLILCFFVVFFYGRDDVSDGPVVMLSELPFLKGLRFPNLRAQNMGSGKTFVVLSFAVSLSSEMGSSSSSSFEASRRMPMPLPRQPSLESHHGDPATRSFKRISTILEHISVTHALNTSSCSGFYNSDNVHIIILGGSGNRSLCQLMTSIVVAFFKGAFPSRWYSVAAFVILVWRHYE
jgi:hypothetical protein